MADNPDRRVKTSRSKGMATEWSKFNSKDRS